MSLKRKSTNNIPSDRPVCYDTIYNVMCVNCYHCGCPCMNCEYDISHKNTKLKEINISWETFKKYSVLSSSDHTYEEYVRVYGYEYNNKKVKSLF